MNNKVLIRLGILVLVVLVILIFSRGGETVEHGNKYVVTTTKVNKANKAEVKNVFLLMDPSGSMKGYLDFKEYPDAKKTMVSTITRPLDRLIHDYQSSLLVKYGTSDKYMSATVSDLQTKMTTGAAFSGATTMLAEMITDAVKQTSDTSISVLMSDMVLSYGKKAIIASGDPWYNKHNLNLLGASIHSALKGVNDVNVLLLQYYSDFNGKYYYNCTENIEKGTQYQNDLMKYRPYYIMVFGKKEMLESLLDNGVFEKSENIYASFDYAESDLTESKLTLNFDKASSWQWDNSAEDPDALKTGTIWTKTDLGSSNEQFEVQFDRFDIPAFLNQKYEIGDYHLSNVIKNIEDVTDPSNPNKLIFRVTMKAFDRLPDFGKVEFTLVCENEWANEASVTNDDDVNITNINELEKKTWGLSTIIKNINVAYFGAETKSQQILAKIQFNVAKNSY